MADAGLLTTFIVPPELEAAEPPEARGLRRDDVRLLVSDLGRGAVAHVHFRDLAEWLLPGDLLVVNTSATLCAALPATCDDGDALVLHLSMRLPGGYWTVEVRRPGPVASRPSDAGRPGLRLDLPAGADATLLAPYPTNGSVQGPSRLWLAAVGFGDDRDPAAYLGRYGTPIRYGYVSRDWPPEMYQTVFATDPGSAEMPSAGRPFTAELVARLVSRGVEVAPLVLHTGVSSLEDHEPPYEEWYRVPEPTAARVTAARRAGRHVVAVGTTVVRALETVTNDRAVTSAGEGWTNLIVTSSRPPRAVTGLITGLHEARATHLTLVGALAAAVHRGSPGRGREDDAVQQIAGAYREARAAGYLWHEFGDSHLILGARPASLAGR